MIDIDSNSRPLEIFSAWIDEAKRHKGIREPNAMTFSTLGKSGEIHSRVVLCKEWSDQGFTFYSNYNSQKGLDLQHSDQASAVFYWDPLHIQVDISGRVSRTSREVSEKYWNSRERESQLSQYISRQSEEVESREELERLKAAAEKQFAGQPIPCPAHWGGYVLAPRRIEFWVGKTGRLHDRFEFQKSGNHWTFRRLYP